MHFISTEWPKKWEHLASCLFLITKLSERLYEVSSKIISYVRRELQAPISRRFLWLRGMSSWPHIISSTCLTLAGVCLYRPRTSATATCQTSKFTRKLIPLHLILPRDCMYCTVLPRPFRPSVCLSNAWIVTKRKKLVPTILYHMKDNSF